MSRLLLFLRSYLARPRVRQALLWSLPALLVGLAIRAVLTAQWPYGIYHDDTGDILTTPVVLWQKHKLLIHGKKTFLVPLVYTALALVRIPLLIGAPLVQHALGLLLIPLVGALCRLWFEWWRWFIIPLTLIVAIDPPMLWYEHVLLSESFAIFSLVLVALTGTLYTRWPGWGRFAGLAGALVFAAGARPEGKLLFGFGLFLLVLLHARRWRTEWRPFVVMLLIALGTKFITHTGQAGLLLYTSVVRMSPPNLQAAPGLEPYIAPIRDDLQRRWLTELSFPKVNDRRAVKAAVMQYKKERGAEDGALLEQGTDDLCLKLAVETCRRNLPELPMHAYQKFRAAALMAASGDFDDRWSFERQQDAFSENLEKPSLVPKLVMGRTMTMPREYDDFLRQHYHPLAWFNRWDDGWLQAVNAIRLPDEIRQTGGKHPLIIRHIPVLFLLGGVGVLIGMLRWGKLQPLHVAWGLTLLAFFFTIMLTANVRPRFRILFEPWWYIYLAMILDCLAWWILPRRWRHDTAALPALAPPSVNPTV